MNNSRKGQLRSPNWIVKLILEICVRLYEFLWHMNNTFFKEKYTIYAKATTEFNSVSLFRCVLLWLVWPSNRCWTVRNIWFLISFFHSLISSIMEHTIKSLQNISTILSSKYYVPRTTKAQSFSYSSLTNFKKFLAEIYNSGRERYQSPL